MRKSNLNSRVFAAIQVNVEGGPQLDRGFEVRHAAALAVVAHRRRQVEAQIDFEPILIEQCAAHTVAVGFQKLAVVYHVGDRYRVGVHGIRAAIILKCDRAQAESKFPQGYLLGVTWRRPACGRGKQRDRVRPGFASPLLCSHHQPLIISGNIFALQATTSEPRRAHRSLRYRAMHILIVEDDEVARDYLAKALRQAGHTVDVAGNGLEGLHMASSIAVDLAIVDRMLPKLDGLALVQSLRATGRKMPVLILSALGDVDDRITGLRAGGDDYLTKPYHMSELLARIDALARRGEAGNAEANTKLKLADLELDRMTRRVTRNGKKIELTAREFQLLEFMMRHSGQVVTRTMLLEGVWDYHFDPQTNVIDVHISRLRQAIDKDFDKPLLHTVRGAGYSLREDE